MSDTLQTIHDRRSCRSFLKQPIPREQLEAITSAASRAPSARNRHTRRLTVVQDPELLTLLAHTVAEAIGAGEDYCFYNPDALILTSDSSDNPLAREDCACALENMFLAAEAQGIGSVWINQFFGICDQPNVRRVLSALGIPADHQVWGCAALGYPAQKNENPPKTDEIAWF